MVSFRLLLLRRNRESSGTIIQVFMHNNNNSTLEDTLAEHFPGKVFEEIIYRDDVKCHVLLNSPSVLLDGLTILLLPAM